MRVQFLGWEDPLEKGMSTHSRILACRIPWTEEPGRLQSMGSQRARYDWVTFTFTSCLKMVPSSISPLHSTVGLTSWRIRPWEALRDTSASKLLQEDFKRSLKYRQWKVIQTHDQAYLVSQGGKKKSGLTSWSLTLNQRHQKNRGSEPQLCHHWQCRFSPLWPWVSILVL